MAAVRGAASAVPEGGAQRPTLTAAGARGRRARACPHPTRGRASMAMAMAMAFSFRSKFDSEGGVMGKPTGERIVGPLLPMARGFLLELIEMGYSTTAQSKRLRLMG